jgi:hypothetical protein
MDRKYAGDLPSAKGVSVDLISSDRRPEVSITTPEKPASTFADHALLALEVAPIGRVTADRHGAARIDPPDVRRKIRFGARHASTANCSSSGSRSRSQRRQVHGQTTGAAQPGMANLFAQPRAGHSRHGPVRCSNDRFRPALCLRYCSVRPQRPRLDQLHGKSDGGMVARQIRGHSPRRRLRATSSAIATVSMAASSRADCATWASGTSLPHRPRPGRMALPND